MTKFSVTAVFAAATRAGVAFLVLASLAGRTQAQCPGCTQIVPCPGNDFNVTCADQLDAVINNLYALGLVKQNGLYQLTAACIADLRDNHKIRLCGGLDPNEFMQTRADCRNPGPPEVFVWCPLIPSINCICINDNSMTNCDPNDANGDPVASLAILMAALAHEACHAKTGNYATADNGLTYHPPCAFVCNEVDCVSLELEILECIKKSLPPNPAIDARITLLNSHKATKVEEKLTLGC